MRAPAPAKINLALVVGPARGDGRHEVATVLQRVDLGDRVRVVPAPTLAVTGFPEDTIVREALTALAAAAGVEPRWRATIAKRIPVAAGLGGGSSDAATALRLANETLETPLAPGELHALAATIGADVPFFLADGPQLGRGDGGELERLDLPQDYWVVLALPHGAGKESTAAVYRAFDERGGAAGWEERRAALERALAAVATAARPRRACPATTSPRHRSQPSCSVWAPSGPTSAGPARRSTASSTIDVEPQAARRALRRAGADVADGAHLVRVSADRYRVRGPAGDDRARSTPPRPGAARQPARS